ncbi:LysR family transcriptional regulator, partial [Pseudomonas aeruginosa]|nr:LysR family transcriptional regulator [Pseudomonas aeruginosa]
PPGLPPFALHLSWSRAADQDPANLWCSAARNLARICAINDAP